MSGSLKIRRPHSQAVRLDPARARLALLLISTQRTTADRRPFLIGHSFGPDEKENLTLSCGQLFKGKREILKLKSTSLLSEPSDLCRGWFFSSPQHCLRDEILSVIPIAA